MRCRTIGFLWLLISLLAASAWAFQPGPDIIRECPKCKAPLMQGTTLSGNTFNSTLWTDGRFFAPMLPERLWYVKCPKCKELFWIDEAKQLGEQPWESFKENRPWPNAEPCDTPSEADYLNALVGGDLRETKVAYLRIHAWWCANDWARTNVTDARAFTPAQQANMQALASSLDKKNEDDLISIAEISRELGRFDECIELLQHQFADPRLSRPAHYIRYLAEIGDPVVRRFPDDDKDLAVPPVPELTAAADKGQLEQVERLLADGADIEATTQDKRTALIWACIRGHDSVVLALLAKGADMEATDEGGMNAFQAAACHGQLKVMDILLEHGASIDARGPDGVNAFLKAAEQANFQVMDYLLAKGVDINTTNRWGDPVFKIAAEHGQFDVMDYLLARGGDVNIKGFIGYNALLSVAGNGRVDVAKYLLTIGADINARSESGWTAFMTAVEQGRIEIMDLLLSKGLKLEERTDYGDTSLMMAAAAGRDQFEAVRYLLAKGADINATNQYGSTALLSTFLPDRDDKMAIFLLENGADANIHKEGEWTALMVAAGQGRTELAEALIAHGADVNARDEKGFTPLILAAGRGHEDIVRILLDHGADATAKGADGMDALAWAKDCRKTNIIGIIETFTNKAR